MLASGGVESQSDGGADYLGLDRLELCPISAALGLRADCVRRTDDSTPGWAHDGSAILMADAGTESGRACLHFQTSLGQKIEHFGAVFG